MIEMKLLSTALARFSRILIFNLFLIVDSIITETIRLSSGVFMIRYIKEDTMLALSTGKRFLMRKGDRVAMYPPAIHKDPEIFENPLVSSIQVLLFQL